MKFFFTGLDPAGPLFYFLNSHLISSDARFVGIIHADIGGYGLALKTGDVDFFPNYGHRPQPNCPLIGPLLSQMGSYKSLSLDFFNFSNEKLKLILIFFLSCYFLSHCFSYILQIFAVTVDLSNFMRNRLKIIPP